VRKRRGTSGEEAQRRERSVRGGPLAPASLRLASLAALKAVGYAVGAANGWPEFDRIPAGVSG